MVFNMYTLLIVIINLALAFSSDDYTNLPVSYYRVNDTYVVNPPPISGSFPEEDDLNSFMSMSPSMLRKNSVLKYRKFALELLKNVIFPYSTKFRYNNPLNPHVRSAYFKDGNGRCIYEPYMWVTIGYENCQLDILELEFDRSESRACIAPKCVVKFASKVSTNEKATSSWKIGGKISQSLKIKTAGSAVESESTTTLEISGEYGESRESMVTHENSFETSIELGVNQVGIPSVLVGGVKCDVSVTRLNYTRHLEPSLPLYEWHIVKKLESCSNDEMKGLDREIFFDVLPDPFQSRQVLMPLYDDQGRIVKIKYIQIHHIKNNDHDST